jgi:hypothetical protein
MVTQCGGEMSAGRKSQNAYAVYVNLPLCRMLASQTDGALRIGESFGMRWIRPGIGDSVFQQHAVHVDGVQPIANLSAFKIVRKNAVTSAGEDHNRRAAVV